MFDAWLGVSWRAASFRTRLDLERLYNRPSGYATWTAFYVMSYACAHGRCHTARRPPHVMFLTRPSPRLAIFIACYVTRPGEGLGTRLEITCVTCYCSPKILLISPKYKLRHMYCLYSNSPTGLTFATSISYTSQN